MQQRLDFGLDKVAAAEAEAPAVATPPPPPWYDEADDRRLNPDMRSPRPATTS